MNQEYDITLCSIMRNSKSYIDRYFNQADSLLKRFENARLCIVEGDSTDDTLETILEIAKDKPYDISIGQNDNHGRHWRSVDNILRWRALEAAWNSCLALIKPSKYIVIVESDLIWDVSIPLQVLERLNKMPRPDATMLFPMLMKGEEFYDLNAFRFKQRGLKMFPQAPYFPIEVDRSQPLSMKTGGGMLVTTGAALEGASWIERCVLHFRPEVDIYCLPDLRIEHP